MQHAVRECPEIRRNPDRKCCSTSFSQCKVLSSHFLASTNRPSGYLTLPGTYVPHYLTSSLLLYWYNNNNNDNTTTSPQHSAQADCRDQGCYQAQGCYQEPIQLERTCGGTSISQYSVLASVHYRISYERAGDHERCCDGMLDASSPFAPKTEARCPSRPGSWTVGRKKICHGNRGVL